MAQSDSIADSLCVGSYNVMVVDAAGDTVFASESIFDPPILFTTIGTQQVTCYDSCIGYAWVDATGGALPYYYIWDDPMMQTNDTAYNLCADSICGTVIDAEGCAVTLCDSVTQPQQPNVSVQTFDASGPFNCDGYAIVTVTGGTPPYAMDFMGSGYPYDSIFSNTIIIDSLCPGDYWFLIQDWSGCACTPGNQPWGFSIGYGGGGCTPPWSVDATNCGSCDGYIFLDTDSLANCANGPFTTSLVSSGGPISGGGMSYSGLCGGNYYLEVTDGDGNTYGFTFDMSEPQLNISVGVIPDTCEYCIGYVDLNPDPGMTYWGSGLSMNCAGDNGLIYVADTNNCVDSLQIGMYSVPTLTVTTVSQNGICPGACDGVGQVTAVVPTVGAPPYTYDWYYDGPLFAASGDSVNLCASPAPIEVVVQDADGCYGYGSVFITEPPGYSLISSLTQSNPCNGDSLAELTFAMTGGGTPGYTYQWSNGDTTTASDSLWAGPHTVTITDAVGCTWDTTLVVTDPPVLGTFPNLVDPSCFGLCNGIIIPNPSGGTPGYSYSWSTGSSASLLTGLCDGSYDVTVTDANGCEYVEAYTLTEPPPLMITMTSVPDYGPSGIGLAIGTVSGGTPPYSYLWDDPLAQTTDTATGLFANTYTVIVTDANGCVIIGNIIVEESVGIAGVNGLNKLVIYPNPSVGDVSIRLDLTAESDLIIEVLDPLGRVIYSEDPSTIPTGSTTRTIPLDEFIEASGIYLMRISVNDNYVNQPIIISK